MSNIFSYLNRSDGRIPLNLGSGALVSPVESQHLNLDDAGAVYAALDGTIAFYGAGLPFDADGRLVVSTGVAVDVTQSIPFTATGAVAIVDVPVLVGDERATQGILFAVDGRLVTVV